MDYRDVKQNSGYMKEMLEVAKGRRDVPVIVEEGKVTIGFGGS